MTITEAIQVANDGRPISYRERTEAIRVLGDAVVRARVSGFNVLAKARKAHLDKLKEMQL